MQHHPITKYAAFEPVKLPKRQWPSRVHERAPVWCSVDLRDGNQALATPMSVDEKLAYFQMLVEIGFKEIEVGFPSASEIEFDFIRRLIDDDLIPRDVAIQVLCQCRSDLIDRTCQAIAGAPNVIFHLYNSTSPLQRKYVFGATKAEIKKIATDGTSWVKAATAPLIEAGMNLRFEYSPESFTSTELDFALEVCEAVTDVWCPTPENKIILNLPATVEYATPNVHADQIEWMSTHFSRRDCTVLSVHTHNDRGCGVAATELALLAGADRVEGTLFGNGERTGNLDIVTVALNLYTHGIDPLLDFSDLPKIRETYELLTRMEVHPRHPYAGDLVFTAFSGSHQDAIKKSWAAQKDGAPWDVLYIPVDPADLGRSYQAIVRINSQSGKGGVAYILEHEYGYDLPKAMQKPLGKLINKLADEKGLELSSREIHDAFAAEFIDCPGRYVLDKFTTTPCDGDAQCVCVDVSLAIDGTARALSGTGNGPLAAFMSALGQVDGLPKLNIAHYAEHALGGGSEAKAISYVCLKNERSDEFWGASVDTNISLASVKAIVAALNRVGA